MNLVIYNKTQSHIIQLSYDNCRLAALTYHLQIWMLDNLSAMVWHNQTSLDNNTINMFGMQ